MVFKEFKVGVWNEYEEGPNCYVPKEELERFRTSGQIIYNSSH